MKSNISQNEIEAVGYLLLRQYGAEAMTVAELMTNQHLEANDTNRASLWTAVQLFLTDAGLTPATIH